MKKKILITGADGFIGRNLVESLKHEYSVFGMNHKELDLLNEKLVFDFIDNNNIDIIVHCANTGGSRKTFYDAGSNSIVENNLRMFMNLVKCMKPHMTLINLGSGAEYDKTRNLDKVSEKEFEEFIPKDSYGFSKYMISKFIESFNNNNIICLRIFGLYGKYEDYLYKYISNSIIKNIFKLPIVINQNACFDYLYIKDFIQIIKLIIKFNTKDKFINITPTQSIDLIDIAEIINDISSFKSDIVILNEGNNKIYTGDNSVLLKNFNNFKFTSYKDGISELYNYYLSISNYIDKNIIKEDKYLRFCKTNS